MEYKAIIARVDTIVDRYDEARWDDAATINQLSKDLSVCLYRLETIRNHIHNNYQVYKKGIIDSGHTAAKAETDACVEMPEMYAIRHAMDGANRVIRTMSHNITYRQSEMKLEPAA